LLTGPIIDRGPLSCPTTIGTDGTRDGIKESTADKNGAGDKNDGMIGGITEDKNYNFCSEKGFRLKIV